MISLILLSVFYILLPQIYAQGCCAAVTCGTESECICNRQTNLPTCFNRVTANAQNFSIGPIPKGFYYQPVQQEYNTLTIITCFKQSHNYDFAMLSVSLEGEDGKYSNGNWTLYSTTILNRCATLIRDNQQFDKKDDDKYQRFLILFSTTTLFDIQITIRVQVSEKKQSKSIVVPILIGISALITTSLVFVSIWCLYRRCRQRNSQNFGALVVPLPNSHIEIYMPALLLSQIKERNQIHQQIINCTVCLVDILDQDSVRRSLCGHIFHQNCIDQWIKKNLNCPLCRFPLDRESLKKQVGDKCRLSQSHNATQNILIVRNQSLVHNI